MILRPTCDLTLDLDVAITWDPEGTWHRAGCYHVEVTGPCVSTIYGRAHALRPDRADRIVDTYHAEIVEAYTAEERDYS